jgi:hypothetical protein
MEQHYIRFLSSDDASSGNRRVRGWYVRIGDANLNCLKAPFILSRRHFQRLFQIYIRPFWPASEVRRRLLENRAPGDYRSVENRRVRTLSHCAWRCNSESNQRSIRPINNGLLISGFADVTAVIVLLRGVGATSLATGVRLR